MVIGDTKANKALVCLGEGNGNPLQYSCLENPMGRRAWEAAVHRVAKSWTRLSGFTSLHFTSCLSELTVWHAEAVKATAQQMPE